MASPAAEHLTSEYFSESQSSIIIEDRIIEQGFALCVIDGRISAQGSMMTIHSDPTIPIQPDTKYVVPLAEREGILRTLNGLGVNEHTMFPGMEGAASHLKHTVPYWIPDPGVESA